MRLEPTSEDELRRTVETVRACGGDKAKAARQLDLGRTTVRKRLEQARKRGLLAPVFVSASVGDDLRILVVPDGHDKPGFDQRRFSWIGRHIADTGPDQVKIMGDFSDLLSLCGHIPNESYTGKFKPEFIADMASLKKALKALVIPGPSYDYMIGNHENRLYLFEENTPEVYGLMRAEFELILEDLGVARHPFGEHHTVGQTDFVHVPLSIMGRPIGGKLASTTIGRESTNDTVFAHTHRKGVHDTPKLGGGRITTVEAGCALPWGYVEEFARHSTTGWWWGVVELKLRAGRIQGVNFVPMYELEERYG